MMTVGYKLIKIETNEIIKEFGGIWGQQPSIPNPLILPNDIQVNAPDIDVDYFGYKLINWEMEEPIFVPYSITPRQVRLLLLQQNLLSNVETMISQQGQEVQITWQYALEFQRNDPLLNQLAENLGLTSEQIDQFFITASKL